MGAMLTQYSHTAHTSMHTFCTHTPHHTLHTHTHTQCSHKCSHIRTHMCICMYSFICTQNTHAAHYTLHSTHTLHSTQHTHHSTQHTHYTAHTQHAHTHAHTLHSTQHTEQHTMYAHLNCILRTNRDSELLGCIAHISETFHAFVNGTIYILPVWRDQPMGTFEQLLSNLTR